MRVLLLAWVGLLSLAFNTQARLGETEEQIKARYGKPVDTLTNNAATASSFVGKSEVLNLYKSNGYQIGVYFKGKASYFEMYNHEGTEVEELNSFTDKQAEQILSINAKGMNWKVDNSVNPAKAQKAWRRDDGAFAAIDLLRTKFMIMSAEAYKDVQAENVQKEKEALSHF